MPFQQRCGEILRTVFADLITTEPRGELDKAGIDHCTLAKHSDDVVLAFQCKGFEVQFGSAQFAQCLNSIRKFVQSPFRAERYFLVVNSIVKGEPRNKLEAALQEISIIGKANSARLLDTQAFLEMVFVEAQTQLTVALRSSLADFLDQHRQRMEEGVYFTDVPCMIAEQSLVSKDPLGYVEKKVRGLVSEPNNKRLWIFVSGEFGFGKTSLALHLAERLERHSIVCLYLPAARFHAQAFEGDHKFFWEALRILLQEEEVDQRSERHLILHAALKEIFKREKRIVLIFDGIDEHPICWRDDGLQSVFGIFKQFNATCLKMPKTL
jgi:hypothetical protein